MNDRRSIITNKMSERNEDRTMKCRIPDFYDGKSIFITGAAGYLGVLILETLLRTCPGIPSIYILLREKKGVPPECRKEKIFKKRIFDKLLQKEPEVTKKVRVVAGDVTLPCLGICHEDMLKIAQEVSVVFHCAASISFIKPLRFMIENNAIGTYNVIEMCRKLKRLDAFIYTSTAYSNSNRRKVIEEIIYRLPFPAQRFLEEYKYGTDEGLRRLADECKPAWPNHYTFSKCLAENIILDYASDLPTAIVRPSIIVASWKGIVPGYCEEGSGMVDLSLAVGKGFVRAIHGDPENKMNVIPVDIVSNAHIVSAWSIANNKSKSPLVINCALMNDSQPTFYYYQTTLLKMIIKYPLPKSFQRPSLTIQKNKFLYFIHAVIEHYIPALVIDTLLRLSGRKPRMLTLYRFYETASAALLFFVTHCWNFQTDGLKILAGQLDSTDEKNFYVDTTDFTVEAMAKELPSGAPFYEWGIDKKPMGERSRVTLIRYLFTSFIKSIVFVGICFVLFIIVSQFIKGVTSF